MKIIHVEASTFCNARCPLCPRSLYGYKVEGVYPEVHLQVDKFKEALKKIPGYEFVYINGHLGDPMMNPNILELALMTKCQTSITTNGSIGSKNTWQQLAKNNIKFIFSIDGLEDTNHLYRQDVEWNKIMDRVKWFIDAGGHATWKFILFRHNMHQVEQVKELSKELGFKDTWIEDDGRSYGPALDKNANITHWILPHNKPLEPHPYYVKEGIERYKETHQNFQVEPKLYNIQCEYLKNDDTYINAKGEVGPCCYHGYDMPGRPFVKLEDHYKLRATWATKKCNPVCAMSCGNN